MTGAHSSSPVHDLADLFRVDFAQAAAEHGKILAEHIDSRPSSCPSRSPRYRPELFFGHAQVGGAMLDEHVQS